MEAGDMVWLRAYGGEKIARRVVEVKGDVVVVCQDNEYQAAAKEGRPPIAVGFNVEDVLGEASQRTMKP
ncbi:MAG: hypothetical protein HY683_06175 [Chloroflexi bacterium]|nr:hypothetical protein [Chloroflexota bacterium]